MKYFFVSYLPKLLIRLIISPFIFITNIFKVAWTDIPKATNQENTSLIYIAAWMFTFPLMMGFTVVWALFKTIWEVFTEAEWRAKHR
tara:strand:+ start:204 stop:464 length:261 start_codon:yes stop_codon:yes gene_type:complete